MTLGKAPPPFWASVSPLPRGCPSNSDLYDTKEPLCQRVGQTISEHLRASWTDGGKAHLRGQAPRESCGARSSSSGSLGRFLSLCWFESTPCNPGRGPGLRQNLEQKLRCVPCCQPDFPDQSPAGQAFHVPQFYFPQNGSDEA